MKTEDWNKHVEEFEKAFIGSSKNIPSFFLRFTRKYREYRNN